MVALIRGERHVFVRKEGLAKRGLVPGSNRTGLENTSFFSTGLEMRYFFDRSEDCPLGLKQSGSRLGLVQIVLLSDTRHATWNSWLV